MTQTTGATITAATNTPRKNRNFGLNEGIKRYLYVNSTTRQDNYSHIVSKLTWFVNSFIDHFSEKCYTEADCGFRKVKNSWM
jgi:hypothetical protein